MFKMLKTISLRGRAAVYPSVLKEARVSGLKTPRLKSQVKSDVSAQQRSRFICLAQHGQFICKHSNQRRLMLGYWITPAAD